jgi:hypothetical protein
VNRLPVGEAVEPLHGERLAFLRMGLFGQALDACDINELVFRDGDADAVLACKETVRGKRFNLASRPRHVS